MTDNDFDDELKKAIREMGPPGGEAVRRINADLANSLIELGYTHKQVAEYMLVSPPTLRKALAWREKVNAYQEHRPEGD